MKLSICLRGIAAAVAVTGAARAGYICRPIAIPGAASTQAFGINRAGQIVANSELGPYLYSAGAWQPLPPAPAGSGFKAADLAATGLNDYGVIVGAAFPEDGSPEQGLLLSNGHYTFFTNPYAGYSQTEARAVNNAGVVTGVAYNADTGASIGFIYNPSNAPGYERGFTPIVPHYFGVDSVYTIIQQINDAGQFVGSGRFPGHGVWSFLYDPAVTPHFTYFRADDNLPTRARALNDRGQLAGAVQPSPGTFSGFMRDSAGDHYFSCPELKSVNGIFVDSMNDDGLIVGSAYNPAFTGFVAYPGAAAEIADLERAVTSVGPGRSLEEKIDGVAAAQAAGDTAEACELLAGFTAELKAQTGKKVPAENAASFSSEAQSIASALGCR